MKDKGWWVQGAGREEEGRDEERGRRQIREAIPPSVAASAVQSSMPESIAKSSLVHLVAPPPSQTAS